jgi:hypothetical protein
MLEVFENPMNFIFTAVLLIFFVFALVRGVVKGRLDAVVVMAPNLLTSLGIFGTFAGIFIGLLDFDVSNIDESVPSLLSGMTTAFWSSVIGMALSIVFKLMTPFFIVIDDSNSADGIDLLSQIKKEINSQSKLISGDGDSSLITQLKNLRSDVRDQSAEYLKLYEKKTDEQIVEFREFAKQMAENNSKALIEALNEVIKDFNKKLTEQFGENFKELNVAVGRMVDWQEEHKINMDALQARLDDAVKVSERSKEALEKSQAALAAITIEAEKVPDIVEAMGEANKRSRESIEEMVGALNGFAEMREKAKQAFPEIKSNLEALSAEMKRSMEEVGRQLAETQEEGAKALVEGARSHAEQFANVQIEVRDTLQGGVEKLEQTINESFKAFDEQMKQELTRALNLLGSQLGSISVKLTDDYSSFAAAANKVMQAANGIDR